jgi:hypothetical protein
LLGALGGKNRAGARKPVPDRPQTVHGAADDAVIG